MYSKLCGGSSFISVCMYSKLCGGELAFIQGILEATLERCNVMTEFEKWRKDGGGTVVKL
jgi:hypothetical protein